MLGQYLSINYEMLAEVEFYTRSYYEVLFMWDITITSHFSGWGIKVRSPKHGISVPATVY